MRELEDRDWIYTLSRHRGVGRKTLWAIYEEKRSFEPPYNLDWLGRREGDRGFLTGITAKQVYEEKVERKRKGIQFITYWDQEYPDHLREIPDPPILLYYRGNLDLLRKISIGVVGTRNPSAYGRDVCKMLVSSLAKSGMVIVSGVAKGIDTIAHQTALQHQAETIGVLGNGLDQIYPAQNRLLYAQMAQHGLVISEYSDGTAPRTGFFPERNRIISGLCWGTIVVEAAAKSGSLITARCALEQNREVFAVPGSIFAKGSEGTHYLIKEGAKLIGSLEDIIEELPYHLQATFQKKPLDTEAMHLSAGEKAILSSMKENSLHIDEIKLRISKDFQKDFHIFLLLLVGKGLIEEEAGQFYRRREV
ncbi:DNA-processing protein DprA [Brevibacillus laterosporus]|uniref:DNA-processing protein DprA n=1 Tax=Brevibacillus laterosporus TaxID=1465 RepID=UPI000364F98E|nr:DNA-processing protein DprA [Brevibacillus laterosporus]ATO47968.1 DNA protecting protein DprA [Brevibacillus laterosporus DSM 25]MBG9803846.1 protein Smf [Brevibacillus laterosporus]MED2003988.1 DNA-processing protein DprA [Brevibacillus laterosporus]MED4765688.1 DNA-processing protein DprA [Brevibacillus laterosporus]TPH21970.1 DNA-protecting protein DprA [Brevibacillus laterosporus]